MGDIPVDVHFDLFKLGFPSSLDAEIWARSTWLETVTVPLTVRVLDPETSLLHALIHLGRDRFRRLLGYVDVAHMVEHGEINWDEMQSLARAEGIDSPAAVALSAVADIQHLKVGPIESHGWRLPLWKFLWRDETRLLGDVGNYKFRRRGTWLLPLTTRGRGLEAFRWIVKTILPPGALLDELHPGLSGPYLWRLIYGRSRFLVHRLRSLSGAKHPTQPTISSDPPSKGAPDVGDRSGDT